MDFEKTMKKTTIHDLEAMSPNDRMIFVINMEMARVKEKPNASEILNLILKTLMRL